MHANSVEVLASSVSNAEPLFEALNNLGLRVRVGGELRIVIAPSQRAEALSEIAAMQIVDGRPWLLVAASGDHPGVGPLFLPSAPPCWNCLVRRMWINGHGRSDSRCIEIRDSAVVSLVAREAESWLRRRTARTLGQWISIDVTGNEQRHPLIAVCPSCTTQSKRVQLAIPKLTSGITGLVERIETNRLASGLFRAVGRGSQVLVPDHALRFLPEARQLIDGKGETEQTAVKSCLGEAVERFSITFQGDEPRLRAAYRDVSGTAVHPDTLILASERQYAKRKWWTRHHGSFQWVKEPFVENCEIEWVQAVDASTGHKLLVPVEYCFLGYGGRFANADSNGCAAGSTKWEAARNAILELIERDAVAIWWYNRLKCRTIHWQRLGSERITKLARILKRARRKFWLLDVTTDLGIPSCVAVSHNIEGAHIALGSGAAFDWETSVWRAMIEMVVQATEMGRMEPPTGLDRNFLALWSWWHSSRIAEAPYLEGGPTMEVPAATRPLGPYRQFRYCVERIEAAGSRVLLYEHTRPELKIPVIRVMAPGLRHFWARFAPGRLYDVPVKLGLRSKPAKESELNPLPYFL